MINPKSPGKRRGKKSGFGTKANLIFPKNRITMKEKCRRFSENETPAERGISMKVCPKCGRLYADTASQCPECGLPLEENNSRTGIRDNGKKLPWILAIAAALALVFLLGRYTGQSGKEPPKEAAVPVTQAETQKPMMIAAKPKATAAPTTMPEPTTVPTEPPVVWRVGQTVTMGVYPMESSGYGGDIQWQVLDVSEDKALIITKDCLDAAKFHNTKEAVTWETSDLRCWLNNDFLYMAFSNAELDYIQSTGLSTPDSTYGNKTGGSDTTDKVFCLSIDEAERYFSSDSDRKATRTAYAKERTPYDWWWLRSPGGSNDAAKAIVNDKGKIMTGGNWVTNNDAVRPAMWVKMH